MPWWAVIYIILLAFLTIPEYSTTEQFGMAYAEEFLNAWGEPYRKQLSRWNLWPGNWPFVPQYLWWWRLADKHVQCRIDHPIYTGFKKTVCRRCVTVDLFPEEAARNPG